MSINLSFHSPAFSLTAANEELIKEKTASFETLIPDGSSVQVDIQRDQHHKNGLVFRVRTQAILAREVLLGTADGESFEQGIDLSFEKLRAAILRWREKNEHKRRRMAAWHKLKGFFGKNADS